MAGEFQIIGHGVLIKHSHLNELFLVNKLELVLDVEYIVFLN